MRWRRGRSEPDPETVVSQLRAALSHVLSGDLAGAEVALAEAARLDSSSSDAYLALANVYRARGEIGRAIQIHQNLLLRQDLPADLQTEALLGLALDFRVGGFLGRAEASFQELLEQRPRHPEALRALEEIALEQGDWEQAIRLRRRLGSRDPDTRRVLAHLWVGLGNTHVRDGDEAQARRAFRRALAQDRGCAEAHVALGDQQLRAGRADRAIAHFRSTLDLHPEIGRLILPRLLEAHRAADDLGGLATLLHERLDANRDDLEAAGWLARVLLERGELGEAIELLERLVARAPEHLAARAELARALVRAGREDGGRKAYEELVERLPPGERRLQCGACGAPSAELHWRCPTCGGWDTLT